MPIRRILVAVDGSKPSIDASAHAIDMAKRLDAELTAIYVVSPDIRYNYLEDTITPRLPGALKDIMMITMQRGGKHVGKVKQKAMEKNVSVKTDVIIGISSIVKEIVEYAEKNKIEMIVIGSRGISGIKKMLLGSVASGVVTYAHCPVLVVK
ncbi:MAG: universal stress protein [Thaumarchaeota archaeon]|nr:MAG: universal stress protein [Nitrososphaerota archaeon]